MEKYTNIYKTILLLFWKGLLMRATITRMKDQNMLCTYVEIAS